MLDTLKAGQPVTFTVLSTPRAQDSKDTIERLMRLDPVNKKSLTSAYKKRAQRQFTFNRGNRDWVKRETCAQIVRCAKGATWTMPFTFNVLPDIKSVEKYLKVSAK
jgi:hypothetical protein